MSNVEDRIVQMEFENRSFLSGAKTALSTLAKLKESLNFGGGKKTGLDDLAASANRFSMGNVDKQIQTSTGHWSAWKTAGLIAFATVVHRAVNAGLNIAKALTVSPIKAGLANYETQINAIQTILANTQASGTTLPQVTAALKELNTYANQTVFNFSDMAKNIGTFTAAGVDLKTSVSSIKGISNLAALSGSSAEQASTAMYQLSQAIAAGSVKLQDWNSVVNAGLGGKTFQDALIKTAKVNGVQIDKIIAKNKGFRNSLQEGWLTSKILTQTLSQFTGDLNAKQLKAMGFSDKEAQSILKMGKTAVNAATQIKTISQGTQALKEEVASAWADVFKVIFGDINQATVLFTKIHNVAQNALTGPVEHLADLLGEAAKLGARTKVINGFANAFKAMALVIKAVKDAFHQIFPPATAQDVLHLATVFENFTKKLIPSQKTIDGIRRTFVGLFAALDIARQILKGVFGVFLSLIGQLDGVGGGFLNFTSRIADWLVGVDEALKKGNALNNFFDKLKTVLATPIILLRGAAEALGALFGRFNQKDANGVNKALGRMNDRLVPLKRLVDNIRTAFGNFAGGLVKEFKPAVDGIVQLFSQLGQNISNSLAKGDFKGVLDVINTALLGGIFLLVKKFFSKGLSIDFGGGLVSSIKDTFETLTGSMKAMQTQIKAKSLLLIAGALGILTASVVALSLIDSAALTKALKAMAVGFGELIGSLLLLGKVGAGFIKLPVLAASLNLIATSMLILAGAVAILAQMSWQELIKGLSAVGILLAEISVSTLIISKNSGGMISASVGITAIAIALNILALAVKQFAAMKFGDLAKGLGAVAAALVAIAVGMRLMPGGLATQSAGILLIAVAMNALYLAVRSFAKLDWKQMGKGLAGVAGSLVAIAIGMRLMPKGMVAQAAGLAIVAGSLLLIQKAIAAMAKMSFGTIGKGLGVIAVSLLVLAGAMHVMKGTLPGAIALLAVTGALSVLVPVISKLGHTPWGTIAKGLGTMAIALGLLVAAGFLAEGAALGLFALAAASVALGVGILAAGTGVAALATGIGLLVNLGGKGIAILLAALDAFISKIPGLATAFAQGLVNVLKVIGQNGPAIIKAFSTVIGSLLTAIIENIPKVAEAVTKIIQALLKVINDNVPGIIAAGLNILIQLLNGIKNNIGKVTVAVIQIVTTFLNTLAKNAGKIVASGLNVLVKFLNGIANNIGRVVVAAGNIVVKFVSAIGGQASRIVSAGANTIVNFVTGLGHNATRIAGAGATAIIKFVSGVASAGARIVNAAFKAVADFLNALDQAVNNWEPVIVQRFIQLGIDIMLGIGKGILREVGSVASQLKDAMGHALGKLGSFLGINSPSKLFAKEIGSPIAEGIGYGIERNNGFIDDSLHKVTTQAMEHIKSTLGGIANAVPGILDIQPTITPVLDLSSVQNDAAKIAKLITPSPINATASAKAAQSAAQAQAPTSSFDQTNPVATVTEIKFEQNNTSPKALSEVEIYRNTKNQLAQAKAALGLSTG